jgi:hypothetical protein
MIIAQLLERGADPMIENGRGQSPLAMSERESESIVALVRAASF